VQQGGAKTWMEPGVRQDQGEGESEPREGEKGEVGEKKRDCKRFLTHTL